MERSEGKRRIKSMQNVRIAMVVEKNLDYLASSWLGQLTFKNKMGEESAPEIGHTLGTMEIDVFFTSTHYVNKPFSNDISDLTTMIFFCNC
jgi:hypothetical protein